MNFLTALLTGETPATNPAGDWTSWILIGVLVVAFVVMMIISSRSNKKKQQEQEAVMNGLRPGNKVKTIGGICGIVVEVDNEEGTFVLETGNELNGKSYVKFDLQAIYQSDVKVETTDGKKAETSSDSAAETVETPAEVVAEPAVETAVEEEAVAEAEAPKKRSTRKSSSPRRSSTGRRSSKKQDDEE